jgi:hypothetical protein
MVLLGGGHSVPPVNAKIAEAMFKKFTSAEKAKQLALQAETKAHSLSLLYWYKSTNTDALQAETQMHAAAAAMTHLTSFSLWPSTTTPALPASASAAGTDTRQGAPHTPAPHTPAPHIPAPHTPTSQHAASERERAAGESNANIKIAELKRLNEDAQHALQVLKLLALLVQKYKY